jgi:hypothetical protein
MSTLLWNTSSFQKIIKSSPIGGKLPNLITLAIAKDKHLK